MYLMTERRVGECTHSLLLTKFIRPKCDMKT